MEAPATAAILFKMDYTMSLVQINGLKDLQNAVGGHFEAWPHPDWHSYPLYINENGRNLFDVSPWTIEMMTLGYRHVGMPLIHGPILLVCVNTVSGETESVSEAIFERIKAVHIQVKSDPEDESEPRHICTRSCSLHIQ